MFDNRQVLGKQSCRVTSWDGGGLLERQQLAHDAAGKVRGARAVECGGHAITTSDAIEARNVPQQRREGRRRRGDKACHGCGSAAGFDETLAQMDQVTLDLRFTGPPEVVTRDRGAGEGIVPVNMRMRADDLSVLQRERVERSSKLVVGYEKWRGDAASFPARGALRARFQIRYRQAADQRETREGSVLAPFDFRPVTDHRPEASAENVAQVR